MPQKRTFVAFMLVAVLIATSVGALTLYYFHKQVAQPINLNQEHLFVVQQGDFAKRVISKLKKQGIVEHSLAFRLMVKLLPEYANIKAGTYALEPGLSGYELMALLNSGQEKQFSIALVEGLRWRDWWQQIQQHPYLSEPSELTLDDILAQLKPAPIGDSLEGWLMPDTYHFTANTAAVEIVQRAYQAMHAYLDEAWHNRAIGLPYDSPYQALIMASIIEKETGVAAERAQIAAVFINRLEKNMRLQTDPTVIYGMGEAFDGNIRRKDLTTRTAYNTYVIKGLPPTPIAMPGKLAIQAALNPIESDELYFVAKGDGSHYFSRTLAEHNKAVRKYQLNQ